MVPGQGEALVVGEGEEAGWEEPAPGLDLGGSVYAQVAEPRSFIKPGSPVIV